ncbi:MAG: hypothetical protein M3017_02435 [Actinomycetota bacterium]|nr:hypothetical protein [Actinomycetota bacterium]
MPKMNESQIRAALQAARDLPEADRSRPTAVLGQVAAIGRLERQREALFAAALARTGWSGDRFEALLADSRSEAASFVEGQRSAAARRSAQAKEAARPVVEGRREALKQLTAATTGPAGTVEYFALDSPFLIWPTHGMSLDSSQIEPWNSRAQIHLHAGNSGGTELTGHEELNFYFLWENPRAQYAIANVDGFLVLNGFCDALAQGGILPGTRFSRLQVDTTLRLLEWWNQPPTEPPAEADQTQHAVNLTVDCGGFGDFTHVEIADVFRGYDLQYTSLAVPPQGVVVIEVGIAASYDLEDGSIDVDFSGSAFDVLCPFVQVALLP